MYEFGNPFWPVPIFTNSVSLLAKKENRKENENKHVQAPKFIFGCQKSIKDTVWAVKFIYSSTNKVATSVNGSYP